MSTIIHFNKLVRDNIPAIIEANGGKPKIRVIEDDAEFKKALKAKLLEEIDEFLNAKTEGEAIEELADIYDVITCLEEHFKILQYSCMKRSSKGWFNDRIFLESVEVEENCDG